MNDKLRALKTRILLRDYNMNESMDPRAPDGHDYETLFRDVLTTLTDIEEDEAKTEAALDAIHNQYLEDKERPND